MTLLIASGFSELSQCNYLINKPNDVQTEARIVATDDFTESILWLSCGKSNNTKILILAFDYHNPDAPLPEHLILETDQHEWHMKEYIAGKSTRKIDDGVSHSISFLLPDRLSAYLNGGYIKSCLLIANEATYALKEPEMYFWVQQLDCVGFGGY